MGRLCVKSFGPLKEIDIEINHVNLFIGANGSGKSVLGKLLTIVLDFNIQSEDIFLKKLREFGIDFLTDETVIRVYGEKEQFVEIIDKKITFSSQLEKSHKALLSLIDIVSKKLEALEEVSKEEVSKRLDEIEAMVSSQYIPAERNLISLFSQSLSSFVVAEIPLPKFLLHFSSQYEKARNEIKELDLLGMRYLNNGKDLVYYNEDEYLELAHSSSGMQSALPLYLTMRYFGHKNHHTIVVEEPELNLFPKAQNETIKYLVQECNDKNNLFLMTHSPYVLSSLNILLYAHKVGSLNENTKAKVSALVPESQWINPDKFSAYYLENGTVRSLKGATGLIGENEIDASSDEIDSEFNELVEIYREHKHDR
ncbi:MAG: AAA family ATPase [Sulfuricurvum sp.]|jgi:predicted ATPase